MLTLWRPYRDLFHLQHGFGDLLCQEANGEPANYTPSVDIVEYEDRYVLEADLPGLEEKAIEIKVHDGTLLLTGQRDRRSRQSDEAYDRRERRFGTFARSFELGPQIDAENIAATYKNGVLEVVLPKKPELKPRQIKVSASA